MIHNEQTLKRYLISAEENISEEDQEDLWVRHYLPVKEDEDTGAWTENIDQAKQYKTKDAAKKVVDKFKAPNAWYRNFQIHCITISLTVTSTEDVPYTMVKGANDNGN